MNLLMALHALGNISMSDPTGTAIAATARAFNQELSDETAGLIANVLKQQNVEGSLLEFLSSGGWIKLLTTGSDDPGQMLCRCPHCDRPFLLSAM